MSVRRTGFRMRRSRRLAVDRRVANPRFGSWPLLLGALLVSEVFATDPASLWSVPGQRRTRTCAPMAFPTATLRFSDGTPTGFYAWADDPSANGSAPDCQYGYVEIDAQEILYTSQGWPLYFHPGGGPDHYNDYVNKGQYGHIWAADLSTPPPLAPQNLNGKPCAAPVDGGAGEDADLNLIGVAADGAIYAGSLATDAALNPFRLYRWADESSAPVLVYQGDPSPGELNPAHRRWGDTLAVRGAGTNTQVLLASRGTRVVILSPKDATMTSFRATVLQTDVPAGGLAHGLDFGEGNTFWGKAASTTGEALYWLAFDLNAGTATTLQTWPVSVFPGRIGPLAVNAAAGLMAGIEVAGDANRVKLYSLTATADPPVFLDRKEFSTNAPNPIYAGAVAFGSHRVYALNSDNGILAFEMIATNRPVAPSVFLEPATTTVVTGSNVTLRAAADGVPAPAYQWFHDGQAITGATDAALPLLNVAFGAAGNYSVVVSNAYGMATSAVAVLTVLPPPDWIAYEPFAYAAGSSLAGQGGWLLNSGTSGTIGPGNLEVPALATSLGNRFTWTSASMSLRLPIGTNANGELFFSLALRISSINPASASDTIAGFTTGTNTTYAPKINVVGDASSGGYQIGIYKGGGLTVGALATNVFTTSDTVFLVARYEFNTNSATDDTCDLWLNPAAATFGKPAPPPPILANIGAGAGRSDMSQLDRFFFRSANSATSCAADELRVGKTWAAVTPPGPFRLDIALSVNTATLLWPAAWSDSVLEWSAGLSAPVWLDVTNGAVLSGTNLSVTVGVTPEPRFYRLRR